MNGNLEHKQAFTAIGFSTNIRPEEGSVKCPAFWEKEYAEKYKRLWQTMRPETPQEKALLDNCIGQLALCMEDGNGFTYMIAGVYQGGGVPEGMELHEFPESDWMVFSAKGPLPASLQKLSDEIWRQWYPEAMKTYAQNGTATVEYYSAGNPLSPDYECGIWIPVIARA